MANLEVREFTPIVFQIGNDIIFRKIEQQLLETDKF